MKRATGAIALLAAVSGCVATDQAGSSGPSGPGTYMGGAFNQAQTSDGIHSGAYRAAAVPGYQGPGGQPVPMTTGMNNAPQTAAEAAARATLAQALPPEVYQQLVYKKDGSSSGVVPAQAFGPIGGPGMGMPGMGGPGMGMPGLGGPGMGGPGMGMPAMGAPGMGMPGMGGPGMGGPGMGMPAMGAPGMGMPGMGGPGMGGPGMGGPGMGMPAMGAPGMGMPGMGGPGMGGPGMGMPGMGAPGMGMPGMGRPGMGGPGMGGPGMGGPGPGMGGPMMGPPGAVAAVGAMVGGPTSPFCVQRTEVRFVGPASMKVSWFSPSSDGKPSPSLQYVEAPGRYNFLQCSVYRLKLSDIPQRPGVELYPTLEVVPASARAQAFLAHSAVPVSFTDEDFEQVAAGNYVVKVIYLPDPQYQDLASTGPDEVVSSRLEPGQDPIAEAHKRGSILLVVRIGNIDLEAPNTPAMDAPASNQKAMLPPGAGVLPPAMLAGRLPPQMMVPPKTIVPPGMGPANGMPNIPMIPGMPMPPAGNPGAPATGTPAPTGPALPANPGKPVGQAPAANSSGLAQVSATDAPAKPPARKSTIFDFFKSSSDTKSN